MELREKLKKLDSATSKPMVKNQSSREYTDKLPVCLKGELIQNQGGTFFRKKTEFNLDYRHGLYCLHKSSGLKKTGLTQIALAVEGCNSFSDYQDLLFIDTETTGLMGGTGTLTFMVGLGYFTPETFTVEQYFMRDFDDEPALLSELMGIIDRFPIIVSFNGKSFDLPLLRTRFILNRFPEPEVDTHIDLLHASRSIWSHLESCSLSHLEEKVLGVYRKDDLPGREVPELYFTYLNNKNPELLKPIFRHNLIDIISLVTLLNHLYSIHNTDLELSPEVLFNLARLKQRKKDLEESIKLYEEARKKTAAGSLLTKINKKLSWQYKRADKWDKAAAIWEEMIAAEKGGLFPYREMAKYLEHQLKDYEKAFKCTEQGLNLLQLSRPLYANFTEEKEKLEHRLKRLKGTIRQTRLD